ncbi:hypothetical protein DID77_04525 [Candidatus Marinamargulisbacteria bacterium SCGC AG-439-L15]|nr:hypothetical protein DID77_04525 [Candidatus Marinamargulisbacteria bacterium SCGC AG-439-L15]
MENKVTNDQKEQWEDESRQLKKDLDNRQKVVKKREVSVSFGGKKKTGPKKETSVEKTKESDDFLRRQLGL